MTVSTPTKRITAPASALVAAMLALSMMMGAVFASFADGASESNISKVSDSSSLKVADAGSLRDLIPEGDLPEFDQFMADPDNRANFIDAFQRGLDGEKASDSGAVRSVLAYGFDRDHVWVTASYSDIAKGLITGAVAFCKTRIPAVICTAAGNWLKSLAKGYAPMNSHGVWGAVYWNRYAGGRW